MQNLFFDGSSVLLTDLYQLTMAYGYWKSGRHNEWANFQMYFRKLPFNGGFAVACGIEPAIEWIERFAFDTSDLAYLETLVGADEKPLFESAFLDYLGDLSLQVDIDAVREGAVCFAQEPLIRVQGPVLHCQLLETALLNIVNFQTLIATKAARICLAARGEPVLEFGARRAQGVDGALSASRAAFVGGCAATSHVLAGKCFNIPVRGTHAHSWVMLFGSEPEAFDTYADALPNNVVFLVDTYDTLEGVHNAVAAGLKLRQRGYDLLGIRLDSGDLAYLSIEARKILDAGGFPDATIFASNDLDENLIASLKEQGAKIGVWGVGTRLVTGNDQPALGGVYKLTAVRDETGIWEPRVKLSEQSVKISTPGVLGTRRFINSSGQFVADAIYEEGFEPDGAFRIVDPLDPIRRRHIEAGLETHELLEPAFRGGKRVRDSETLHAARERAESELASLNGSIKRFVNPHSYPVGLEEGLHARKFALIERLREK
ncbi:nicotinate phosphoribosyltransferase pncB2 [Abditibacteriota bacterium]|nr:nicotinate phosphoribosyltransferase pncB2 [Abditibacteriota bacterium]